MSQWLLNCLLKCKVLLGSILCIHTQTPSDWLWSCCWSFAMPHSVTVTDFLHFLFLFNIENRMRMRIFYFFLRNFLATSGAVRCYLHNLARTTPRRRWWWEEWVHVTKWKYRDSRLYRLRHKTLQSRRRKHEKFHSFVLLVDVFSSLLCEILLKNAIVVIIRHRSESVEWFMERKMKHNVGEEEVTLMDSKQFSFINFF